MIFAGEEGTSDGVLNVIHALVAAFDDLFPSVPMEDIISKVSVLNLQTFYFNLLALFIQFSFQRVHCTVPICLINATPKGSIMMIDLNESIIF